MLRYKVVSGEMFLAAPWLTGAHSSRLTEPTGNSNAPSSGGRRGLVTLYVSCALCEPFNVRHMSHLCVSLQQRKKSVLLQIANFISSCSSYDNDLHSIIVERSSNYDNYAVIPVLDRAKVKKKITFNSDTFVQ